MRRQGIAWALACACVSTAAIADGGSGRSPDEAPKPACFETLSAYLKASVQDCPLSVGPLTLYGNLDAGYGYSLWGARVGPSADKANYFIGKNSAGTHWLLSPNAVSTTGVGVRLSQKLQGGWELIGAAESGLNPYSGMLINGPRSLVDNNRRVVPFQTTQFDTSRAGQWDNTQGYIGVSHPDFGSLTFGRTYTLVQTVVAAYDPVRSNAFSQLGNPTYAGLGAGSTLRMNTAVTYRLTHEGVRIGFQAQTGGYDQGNASTAAFQAAIGADFGKLSLDAVGGVALDAVSLTSFSGGPMPKGYDPNTILRATLSNTGGVGLLARYDGSPLRFFAGYMYIRSINPDDAYADGLPTIAQGIFVPAGYVTSNSFNVPRILNMMWTGARWAARPDLDFAAGVYNEIQNDYLPAPARCTGVGVTTSSPRCGGGRYAFSVMAEYRPVPRLSLYAGAMVSNVYGGPASGFQHTQNIDPTVGLRLRF